MEITANQTILVKINENGYKVLYEYWHQFDEDIPVSLSRKMPTLENLKAKKNSDGFTEMQLWHFMQVFGGDKIYVGAESLFDSVKINNV